MVTGMSIHFNFFGINRRREIQTTYIPLIKCMNIYLTAIKVSYDVINVINNFSLKELRI